MKIPSTLRRTLLGLAAAACLPLAAWAQAYPSKPITLLVPFPPGGPTDLVARVLAKKMSEQMGQSIVIDNKPGANGNIAAVAAAKAPADGYTVLYNTSSITLSPALYKNLAYDVQRDLAPVALTAVVPLALVVNPGVPVNNVREVIAYAKANPSKLNYASAGNGSGQHVLAAALWHLSGADITHVPYKGAQAAYQDLLGGRIDLFFDLSSTARPQVDSGKVKALALSGAERNPMHPNVPTILESGVAQLDLESWFGYFVPSKTPAPIQERLRNELTKLISQPDLQDIFRSRGGKPLNLNAAQTKALVQRDVERWTKLVRDIGIKAD